MQKPRQLNEHEQQIVDELKGQAVVTQEGLNLYNDLKAAKAKLAIAVKALEEINDSSLGYDAITARTALDKIKNN